MSIGKHMAEARLSLKDMAAHFNSCTKTFRKYVIAYEIPHILLGRTMLFDLKEVEDYLKARNIPKKIELPRRRCRVYVRPDSEFEGVLD